MNHKITKVIVSVFTIGVLLLRNIKPGLLDATDLVLIAIDLLPWLSTIIKSVELPGVGKIEFLDLRDAGSKVTSGAVAGIGTSTSEPKFIPVAENDPNLALVGLRIEIEKILRQLAEQRDIKTNQPLMRIFDELHRTEVISNPVMSGLRELVMFGNMAAHGAKVDDKATIWATEYGPKVIAVLDEIVKKEYTN